MPSRHSAFDSMSTLFTCPALTLSHTLAAETVEIKSDALKALDAAFGSALSAIVSEGGFEGKQGSSSKVMRVGAAPAKAKYVALVGLGKAEKLSTTSEWGPSAFQVGSVFVVRSV